MNVHILVSCRNPELWKFSTMVFDSIRVGFPTSKIYVHENSLSNNQYEILCRLPFEETPVKQSNILHDEWIQNLIETETEPFWIVDTDVIFFDNIEQHSFSAEVPLVGTYIPKFCDSYTGYNTFDKLHTCCMYINPQIIRDKIQKIPVFYAPNTNEPTISARRKLINVHGYIYHHDTMSEIYHTLGGEHFTENIKDKFGHINCGTYADLVNNRIPGYLNRCHHLADNPELLRGSWKNDEDFYKLNPWPIDAVIK